MGDAGRWNHEAASEVEVMRIDVVKYRDAAWLVKKYVLDELSTRSMAAIAGCSRETIRYWLDKHGIERRGTSEAVQLSYGSCEGRSVVYRDLSWLSQKYRVEKLSCQEIGRICGVTPGTIHNWLKRHGIVSRTLSEAAQLVWASEDTRYRDEDWLREKYVREKLYAHELGKMCTVTQDTIYRWLRKYGIHIRNKAEVIHLEWERGRFESPEYRRKLSEATKLDWERGVYDEIFASEEHRRKMSESARIARARDDWGSAESRMRSSEARKRAWARGVYDNMKPRNVTYPYKGICLRSSWEVRIARVFDLLGWSWEYEPCVFQYRLTDGLHSYTPDFWVPELGVYFDPHWALRDASDKFKAVREQTGITLIVLNERLLKTYEALAAN